MFDLSLTMVVSIVFDGGVNLTGLLMQRAKHVVQL